MEVKFVSVNVFKHTNHIAQIDTYIKKANINMQINIYIINGSIFPESKD